LSFLIKSDTVCPWTIDVKALVKGRFDVLVDFAAESIRGGAREVYIMLCDGTTYHVSSVPGGPAVEVASWLLSQPSFKASLEAILANYRRVYYLHERGADILSTDLSGDALYVFGDHDGLSREDEEVLTKRAQWLSLGPVPYMSWHAAAYVAFLLRRLNKL